MMIARAFAALLAFLFGALLGPFVAFLFFLVTNNCAPTIGEPCDGGSVLVDGLTIIISPVLGTVFAGLALWLMRIRSQRKAET